MRALDVRQPVDDGAQLVGAVVQRRGEYQRDVEQLRVHGAPRQLLMKANEKKISLVDTLQQPTNLVSLNDEVGFNLIKIAFRQLEVIFKCRLQALFERIRAQS